MNLIKREDAPLLGDEAKALREENKRLIEENRKIHAELGKYWDIPRVEYLSDENEKLKAHLEVAIKLLEGLPSDQYALAMQNIEELKK